MTDALFLTSEELRGLLEPDAVVEAVESAYRQVGDGAPAEPRTTLTNEDPPGMFTGYLAVLPETGAMGGYTYSAGFGAGDAWFMTPVFDAATGEPLAVLDGSWMNPLKTGAAGAVGTQALAREDADSVALIGSGTQARGQLKALASVRALDRVDVYSPTKEHREAFAGEFNQALDATVAAVASSAAAVEGADIVITATRASEPVFDADRLDPGTHVTAMGQYDPEKRELDDATVARSTYVPDLRARAFQDAGSFLHALESGAIDEDHVHAELGEVVAGAAPGRTAEDELTVFDSGGTAVETVAAAHRFYEAAEAADLGSTIEFAPASEAMPGRGDA